MNPILARRTAGATRPLYKFGFASFAALALTSLAPSAANAQTTEETLDEGIEEITVTGSRLKTNPNLTAATPVLSVAGQEGMIRGNVRIEDFINVLPQVFAGQASEVSNGASGTATLNLRGLGANRTLVLIDGRRLPFGSSSISAPNIDIIPLQLVERVDILTGGASAVYGSDAISGVANFILRRNFEGVEVGYQTGSSYNNNDGFSTIKGVLKAGNQPIPGSSTDGNENLIYGILGANLDGGRGNVTIFASYEERDAILQKDRVGSACALGQDTGPSSFGGFGCIGSSNFRRFFGNNLDTFQEESGNIIPFVSGPTTTFNFGPFNFFQRPSERYNIFGMGHYQINDNIEAFGEISFMNNFSDAQIAPSASFGVWSINCDNPFIQNTPGIALTDVFDCSAQDIVDGTVVNNKFMSHRNVEGGPRNSRNENSALRIIGGLRGNFADNVWNWEAFVQGSESRDQGESTNDFVSANLQQALLVTTDANGNAVCINQTGGCVPYNIFQRGPAGESLVTSAATDFIQGVGLVNGSTSQFIVGGSIQADLGNYGVQLPWADYGVGFLLGFEIRNDDLDSRPDEISQIPGGGFTGVGGATLAVKGEVDVDEFYTEIEVPLVSNMTGIQELTLRGQYRRSEYDTSGNNTSGSFSTDAYGISLAWAPIETLRLRAQFQRAVRAPNVIDLFTGQNTNLPNLSSAGTNANGVQLFDPCSSGSPIASLAACQNTGVTAAQFGNLPDVISGQTQSITGGNPDLKPEEADTVTLGFVWTPNIIEGLSVSVDYFDIEVEDAISAGIPAQTTLDECLATGNPTFCDLINRAPNGSLLAGFFGVGFQQTNVNIAELSTSGLDFQILYDFDLGAHNFHLDYASTLITEMESTPFPGADAITCEGEFGNECDVVPEYRHRVVGTWQTPWSVDVSTTWRFFGETDNDNEGDTVEKTLDSVNYIDLAANWYLMDGLITIRGSILNVFGEDPPIFSGAGPAIGNGNTYPTIFDTGTVFFAAVKLRF